MTDTSPRNAPKPTKTSHIVSFKGIAKTYPNGTMALNDVSFDIETGTIHALCGENGAGKSTLMKILFGLEGATQGDILLNGEVVTTTTKDFAGNHGLGMVHQHFSLVPTLTVTENILLGHEPKKGIFIDYAKAREQVLALSKRYDLAINPDAITGTLTVASQQKVEILKALSRETKLLILDEPTAVLSPPEIDELFKKLRDLRAQGLTILFISHKLHEVRALAENVTVLRGGKHIGNSILSEISDEDITQMIMGRAVEVPRRNRDKITDTVIIETKALCAKNLDPADTISNINLAVKAGEIVGIAGVEGSGQRGLVTILTGGAKADSGSVEFSGKDFTKSNTQVWRKNGLAYLPADRFGQGGSPTLSLVENAIAGTDKNKALHTGPFLKSSVIANRVREMIKTFAVRNGGINEPLNSLSGGNAQKLIAARELAETPKFLVADQPTRGIDVASAAFLHMRIDAAAQDGAAVLLITADLDELLRLSDRILVMFNGEVVADIVNTPDLTPKTLGPYMLGLERH